MDHSSSMAPRTGLWQRQPEALNWHEGSYTERAKPYPQNHGTSAQVGAGLF